jgi:hypothetical protein
MAQGAEFIVKFIAESAKNGVDPIEVARVEIQSIDNKLNEAEVLKIRRMNLVSVLDYLGDDTYRRRRMSATPSSDDIDVSSDDMKDLIDKITQAISDDGSIGVRDLIRKVGGYEQDALIMRTVKFLGDQEIVSRDSEGKIQPGKNWKLEKDNKNV